MRPAIARPQCATTAPPLNPRRLARIHRWTFLLGVDRRDGAVSGRWWLRACGGRRSAGFSRVLVVGAEDEWSAALRDRDDLGQGGGDRLRPGPAGGEP